MYPPRIGGELDSWAEYRAQAPRISDELEHRLPSTEASAAECDFPRHSNCYRRTGPRTLLNSDNIYGL